VRVLPQRGGVRQWSDLVTGHRRGNFGRDLKYTREDGFDGANLASYTEDWWAVMKKTVLSRDA
jgi:hypothetical protein